MSNTKKHPLDGHTEIYEAARSKKNGSTVDTYFCILKHDEIKRVTKFCYYFANPRNPLTRNKLEPDIYRWTFRITWDTGKLQKYVQYADKTRKPYWKNCDPNDDFNMFPNYATMFQKVEAIIAEYYILTDTDTKPS